MRGDLHKLEQEIGYKFKDFSLLIHAMRHSSYINERHWEKSECNERLEFLGDAVLELVSSEFLFRENPQMPEGELTKTRASMVCEPSLALCARDLHLGEYLILGRGEDSSGGRNRDSVISDACEALIGAIYLDGGFTSAKEFIHRHILSDLEDKKLFFDSKTILQEMVQAGENEEIAYRLVKEEGPEHDKAFYVDVLVGGKCMGHGCGRSKKAAQQQAAYRAILQMKERGER